MTKEHETDRDPKWQSDELSEEASLTNEDEIRRRILRGDETEGDPDERDDAGAVEIDETPRGKEERQHEIDKERNEDAG